MQEHQEDKGWPRVREDRGPGGDVEKKKNPKSSRKKKLYWGGEAPKEAARASQWPGRQSLETKDRPKPKKSQY